MFWNAFIELVRATIFAAAHVCGGNLGAGIAVVSFTVRLALMPLALRAARRAREQQRIVESLKPQLARLERIYKKDPLRLLRETQALHRANGVRMFDGVSILALGIQAPLFAGLYGAIRAGLGAGVRFLWVADLARPDRWMAGVASLIVAGSVWVAARYGGSAPVPGSAANAEMMMRIQVLIAAGTTLVMLMSAPAALAVSIGAGALAKSAVVGRVASTRAR